MDNPLFSIVTATFNRSHLIHRVFTSLKNQTLKDFEWIIIDDGSTDDTENTIFEMKKNADFEIKYIKTSNRGKAHALNESIKYCDGVLYLVFDSDDWCDPNALEVFQNEYLNLKERSDFKCYAALSALKRYKSGDIVGSDYTDLSKYGLTYIDRINKSIKGDKWECLIFERMKHLKYPVEESEKYMAPSYIWLQLAESNLKTVFINEALSTIEYQSDGISKNNLKNRLNSINSTIRYYKYSYKISRLSYIKAGRYYANFIRFSMHNSSQGEVSRTYFPFYTLGFSLYLKDSIKLYLKKN